MKTLPTQDHIYTATIQASDGGGANTTAMKEVIIEITNVEEAGTVMLSTLQPQVGSGNHGHFD